MTITYETTEGISKTYPSLGRHMAENARHGSGVVKSDKTCFRFEKMNDGAIIFIHGSKSLFDRVTREGSII